MRRKDETLREALLDHARTIAADKGPDAINIRLIAKQAGIAAGTVYNYFKSKDDILIALTEEYWRAALLEMHTAVTSASFCGQLKEIYGFLKQHLDSSGKSLMGSLHSVEAAGRERMALMQGALKGALIKRMEQDRDINEAVFTDCFTKEEYAAFIIGNIMLALRSGQEDIHFLIEIIKRTLY